VGAEPEQFGVVLFDNGKPGPGWVSANGGESMRIAGIGDLDTGCLWLSNLGFDAFHESGQGWNGWLRHAGYLRIRLDRIEEEWGVVGIDDSVRVSYLAGLFSHVMTVSRAMGVHRLRAASLAHEMADLLDPPEFPDGKATEVTRDALQEWTRTPLRVAKETELVALSVPRLVHAAAMFRQPVPLGPWRHLTESRLPPPGKRLQWLMELDVPAVARVKIHGIDGVGDTLGFGLGARDEMDRPIRREWVTSPELGVLSQFANVEVIGAWVGGGYGSMQLGEHIEGALGSAAALSSWSVGLAAENLWVGATRRESRPPRGQTARISWRASWLRAADRMQMFMLAELLSRKGWQVFSYGTGTVTVVAPAARDRQRLIRDALGLGLEVPMGFAMRTGKVDDATWGGEAKVGPVALLRAMGQRDVVYQLDELATAPVEEFSAVVGEMAGAAR